MTTPVFLGYLLVFAAAAAACFLSIPRARQINDPDTRRGLVTFLATSGGWAATHVGFLLAPTPQLKTAVYLVGLIVGFSAVGPWLYFCSAYTGRSLHHNRTLRRTALAVFTAVTALKLTNPLHHQYFTAELTTTPFTHLAIYHGLVHWLVMGLSYALAIVGCFMLLERFLQVSYNTKPLVALVSLTGLPIILDILGYATTALIDITYEPLGVAVFAVGVCFVYLNRFQTIQLAGNRDDPVISLTDTDQIREYNAAAADVFPALDNPDVIGTSLQAVLPELTDALDENREIIERDQAGTTRYYGITQPSFGSGDTRLGRLIVLTDITHRERYQQELERQNERLEQFASIVSHDLRNPLNVASGRLALAREASDNEHLAAIADAHARMEALIDDLLTLARHGQLTDELEPVTLSKIAAECWALVETDNAELVVERDFVLLADPEPLQQLLENLFRNAVLHGAETETVWVGALPTQDGFYIADDGVGIPEDEQATVFEFGYSTATDGTGFGLAIVNEIVNAHGWTIHLTESREHGARFEITDVDTPETTDPSA